MSWWSYEKDANGRVVYVSAEYSGFFPLVMIFFILGSMQYVMNPTATVRFLLWSGFSAIFLAKVPLFRRAIWNSWGSKKMTASWARLYKLGYALIGMAIFLLIVAFRVAG